MICHKILEDKIQGFGLLLFSVFGEENVDISTTTLGDQYLFEISTRYGTHFIRIDGRIAEGEGYVGVWELPIRKLTDASDETHDEIHLGIFSDEVEFVDCLLANIYFLEPITKEFHDA